MRSTVVTADREFLMALNRLQSGRVSDLCVVLGVSATAIRNRLVRMQELGWIERSTVRSDRGRPYHVYRVTSAGRRQMGGHDDELTQLLWREVQRVDDRTIREQMLSRLRTALVERYRTSVTASAADERIRQLQQELRGRGFDVEVGESQSGQGRLPILRENNCPYQDLSRQDGAICDLEQSVFEEVLGFPMQRTQCCRRGDVCCEFEPAVAG